MDTKLQTSLLLILGPIVSFAAWMLIYPGEDSGDFPKDAAALISDPDAAQIGIILGFGGMAAALVGLFNISRRITMGGGAGSSYANIATVLSLVGVAVMFMGVAFEFATANAASVRDGATLLMVGYAGGDAFFPLGMGVLLALVGIAIALEKTYQIKNLPIVPVLIAIAGAAMIVGFFVGSFSNETGDNGDNLFDMIGWMGWMLSSVLLGVLRLRASD